jgi:hypothetical protein
VNFPVKAFIPLFLPRPLLWLRAVGLSSRSLDPLRARPAPPAPKGGTNSPGGVTSLLTARPLRMLSSTNRGGIADPLREDIEADAYADAPVGNGGALEKLPVRDLVPDPARVRLLDDCRTRSLTS